MKIELRPTDAPEALACTFEPADLPAMAERPAAIRQLGRDGLLALEREPQRVVMRFAPDARERVDWLVAAESRCCAFLGFAVEEQPGAVVLTVTAPDGGEPMLAALADMVSA
jgi:hypothetical protein